MILFVEKIYSILYFYHLLAFNSLRIIDLNSFAFPHKLHVHILVMQFTSVSGQQVQKIIWIKQVY